MGDTANLDGVGIGTEEEKPVVPNAKPEFFFPMRLLTSPAPD